MTFLWGTLFGVVLAFAGYVALTRYASLTVMTKFLAAVEWIGARLP